jgi:aminoglycoside phosphotransferase (APT) family kinase protein
MQRLPYAEPPARLAGGFEAAIFGFRLASAGPPFAAPLVLRLFRASRDPQVVRRETAVQNALVQLGYPAARVVASETELSVLGGPFLIMERLHGHLLARASSGSARDGASSASSVCCSAFPAG